MPSCSSAGLMRLERGGAWIVPGCRLLYDAFDRWWKGELNKYTVQMHPKRCLGIKLILWSMALWGENSLFYSRSERIRCTGYFNYTVKAPWSGTNLNPGLFVTVFPHCRGTMGELCGRESEVNFYGFSVGIGFAVQVQCSGRLCWGSAGAQVRGFVCRWVVEKNAGQGGGDL